MLIIYLYTNGIFIISNSYKNVDTVSSKLKVDQVSLEIYLMNIHNIKTTYDNKY